VIEERFQYPVAEALEALGVELFCFGIHEAAFPPTVTDAGYGSTHASGSEVLRFIRGLGFNALQLGPEGQISDVNFSPYDATNFARSLHGLDLEALAEPRFHSFLPKDQIAALMATEPANGGTERTDPIRARRLVDRVLDHAYLRFRALRDAEPDHPARHELAHFRESEAAWLELDALFEALARRIGHDDPSRFDPALAAIFERSAAGAERRVRLTAVLPDAVERALFAQWLADAQALEFLEQARASKVKLFGDLQVGWSRRDRFLRPDLFSPRFVLGAPPSRTNREGQPWGYPLLDPDQLDDAASPAREAFALQLRKLFRRHDGIRIDHPHGLVCPWVYPADATDPGRAVREGTRAFESPDSENEDLRRWVIARERDLNPTRPARYSDDWVSRLDDEQIARYARLVDAVLDIAREHGQLRAAVTMEVLSTCPTPLARVMASRGVGRYRITQKADPRDPHDVYRTDRAAPEDWVMLGNHDTPPIFEVIERWQREGTAGDHAAYLASRLVRHERDRAAAAARYETSTFAMGQALLADLFVSRAKNVFVHFVDLFGERTPYNRAGVVHPENWRLRMPADFARTHADRVHSRRALDPRSALALALLAQDLRPDLVRALETP
jgi:4-alpha-glucanotransferase